MDKYILPLFLLLDISGAVSANALVNGTQGGSVYFKVSVPSQAYGRVSWTLNVNPVYQYGTCSGQFIGRCTGFENGSLILNNITYDDEGEYIMTAISNTGVLAAKEVYDLKVYAALTTPALSSNVTSGPIISGAYLTLQCNVTNQNVTTYNFYRGQTPICSKSNVICNGSSLNFTPISGDDSGSYTCTVQNPVSSNTSDALTLTVWVPISKVVVTKNISGLVWPGIDSVSLKCSALGTNVSYSWSLQGTSISGGNRFQLSGDNSTLTISPVSSSDNGSFMCTATNIISSEKSNITLNLASPVLAVTLTSNTSEVLWAGQDSVSLYCTAQGSAITFSWSLNGNPLSSNPPYYITQSNSPSNSTLTISPISKTDTGPFTCTGTNRANSVTSNGVNLSINWFPDGNIQCTADASGQTVRLGCSWLGGKPAANVTMVFNDTQTTSTDQVFRDISSSSNIHGSNLTCNGYQLGRTSSCVLTFEPPPPSANTSGSTPTVTEGDTVTLNVNLISETHLRASTPSSQVLPAQFSWFLGAGNSPISNGSKFSVISSDYTSTLKIDKVSMNESGTYNCTAKNFVGSTTFNFTVTVSPAPTTTPTTTSPTNSSSGGGSGNDGSSSKGLNGGQIAGIVIGVIAGVAIIGVIVFFVLKKKKRSSVNGRLTGHDSDIGTVQYADVIKDKTNGGMAETTMSNIQEDKDDLKYAVIHFPNNSSTKPTTQAQPQETVYSDVKNVIQT